jgi:hypothetical protein
MMLFVGGDTTLPLAFAVDAPGFAPGPLTLVGREPGPFTLIGREPGPFTLVGREPGPFTLGSLLDPFTPLVALEDFEALSVEVAKDEDFVVGVNA